MATTLEIKLQADVREMQAALVQARAQIKSFGQDAQGAGVQAGKGFTQAGVGADQAKLKIAQAYKTLDTIPEDAINNKIASIEQAYKDLSESGVASSNELKRAHVQMEQMIGALEDYKNGAEIDPAQAQAAANSAASGVASAMEGIKQEIASGFAALGAAAKDHVGASAAIAAIAMTKLKVATLQAGSSMLGGLADPAAQAIGGVMGGLATLLNRLALLAGAFTVLKSVSGLWADALGGNLDAQSTKLLATIKQLQELQSQMAASTVQQAQILQRVADVTGTSAATLASAQGLRGRLQADPQGAADAGFAARDLKGKDALGDSELYAKAAASLQSYTEGLDRNNAAKALGITNTAEFIRFSQQLDAELLEQKARLSELSLTYSDEYIAELQASEAVMRRVQQGNADTATAIKTAYSDAVRPIVTELAELFSGAMPAAIAVSRYAIAGLFGIFKYAGTGIVTVMIGVEQAILTVGSALGTIGRVASAVFAGDFKGAATAFNAGLDSIKTRAKLTAEEVASQWSKTNKEIANIVNGPARGQAATTPKIGRAYTPPSVLPTAPKAQGSSGSDQAKQLADAQYAFAKAKLEAEQKLLEDSLKESLAAYDQAYKDGLVGLEGYYTARESIERERLGKILDIRKAELDAAKVREQEAARRKDEPARLRAAAETVKVQADVELAQNALTKLAAQIETAKRTDAALLESLKLKVNIEFNQLQGVLLDRPMIEADLRGQMRELFTKFADDPVMKAKLEKIVDIKADTSEFKQRLSEIELKQRGAASPLDSKTASINNQRANGQISGVRAQQQLEVVNAAKTRQLEAYKEKLEDLLLTLNDGEQSAEKLGQKLDLSDKINGLTNSIAGLKPAVMDLGVEFENSLETNATQAFDAMINGTKSASQAFSDMAKAIISDIARMIIKMLVLKAIKALTGGFADGGAVVSPQAFASGGQVAGPGGPRDDVIPAWLSNGEHVIDAKTVNQFGGHAFFNALRSIGQNGDSNRASSRISGTLANLGFAISSMASPPVARGLRLADGGAVPSVSSAKSQATTLVQNFNISGTADQRTQSQMGAAAFSGANRAFRRNN